MTISTRNTSELPSSYVDPLAEFRESRTPNLIHVEHRKFDPTPQTGDSRVIHTGKSK